MNETLAKVGDGGVAAANIGAILAYASGTMTDIRVVYVLGALGAMWMACRTAIKITEILTGK